MKNTLKKAGLAIAALALMGPGCAPSTTTPVTTPVAGGIDSALVGTWQLESQIIQGMTNPFSGHTLTIAADGAFTHDYSSTHSASAPSCVATGNASGTLETDSREIHITDLNRSGLNITCTGPGGGQASTNAVPQPLGTGPEASAGAGYVGYGYEFSGLNLVIELSVPSGIPAPSAVYNYVRI